MIKNPKIKKYFLFIFIILPLILLNPFILQFNSIQVRDYNPKKEGVKSSYVVSHSGSWLKNSNFDTTIVPWFPSISGDSSDVNASYSPGQANLEITGDQRTFSEISGTPTETDWHNVTNPLFPALPDNYGIDSYGCWANHTWIDPTDPNQSPSIHWERNVTMPVNMADYEITSASISAVYNATVTAYPGGAGSPSNNYGVEVPGDQVGSNTQYQRDYDNVRFYVLVSDLENNESYEIAWYQSIDLGKDSAGAYDSIADSFMNTVVNQTLIYYLSSLFERDNFHFKITLGIRIKCVDNWTYDRDRWDSLRIKSCNLSFTYEKKIDKFTTVSWNQIGNQITGDNVYITGANLTFKYKIDQPWPEILSPNSELIVLINNNSHSETINLNLATTTFQEAKTEGFDVEYLILKDVNISLSIELYLADDFLLNRTITVSLDDVFLEISYITVYREFLSEPEIFRLLLILALVAAAAVGTYFILYQRILKYPLAVRKVRRYRSSLNKAEAPSSSIADSGSSFNKIYNNELNKSSKYLKLKTSGEINKSNMIRKEGGEGLK
ncbi:MAG: hypothetical protein ACFFBH_04410 [Promethearchaeota archaeon]